MALRVAIAVLVGALLSVPASARAQSEPPAYCQIDPGAVGCEVDDTGPGSGGESEAEIQAMVWGAVEPLTTACPSGPERPQYLQRLVWGSGPNAGEFVSMDDFPSDPGPGDPVPGGPPGTVFAADGFVYQWVCASLDIDADVWAEAIERMDPAAVDRSPAISGLTGLETWAWFEGDPTVEPFQLAWDDPSTGFAWTLEAWAWMGELTWDFGDDTVESRSATGLDAARAAAGSLDDPAATHVYRTTSAGAGQADGYAFSFTGTWIGEYRWSADGGASWSAPVPMTGSYADTAAVAYDVLQVRSALVAP